MRFFSTRKLLIAGAILVLLAATHTYWLGAMGEFLIDAETPVKADAVLVLAGDMDGNRVRKGGDLIRQGFAPVAYVSGPRPVYGVSEATLAINDAIRHGYEGNLFAAVDVPSNSTEEEAAGIAPVLRAKGIQSLIVVTSDYHTRRAGRIWRRLGAGMEIHVVAAPDTFYTARGWWKSRQGRKVAFYEWVKTLTGPLGA